MNFAPPEWVTEAAETALRTVAPNHYSHPKGRIRLREAISKFYGPMFNRELDVESEILVTSGANEGTSLDPQDYLLTETFIRAVRCIHGFSRAGG